MAIPNLFQWFVKIIYLFYRFVTSIEYLHINCITYLIILGGTTQENRAWGWWVNRKGRPRFYWGGGVPGLQKCACGVEGTCTGDSLTCNCDSAGSTTPPLVDQGLLQFKVSFIPIHTLMSEDVRLQFTNCVLILHGVFVKEAKTRISV